MAEAVVLLWVESLPRRWPVPSQFISRFVGVGLLLIIDVSRLAVLAPLLNSMALLIAVGGAWLLLATRWRQRLALEAARLTAIQSAGGQLRVAATQRIDHFFYGFGLGSLALACLLSWFSRLV